jgi:NAD(P)-dependent dehydrogenase (short-subunit alcohol dehydrogenase family)
MTQTKAIFITGAASGIGRAVARLFSARGWFVGLADINEAGLAETVGLLARNAGEDSGTIHKLDVRDRMAWDVALADFTQASGGRLDVLFNNAGIPIGGKIIDLTSEEIEKVLDINLKGVIFGAQAAHKYLKATPGSCLLNTASAAGIYGTPGASVYSATKFGVRAITESLDGEWDEDGIRVRDLMPGFIDTPLLDIAPNRATNEDIRGRVEEAGLEITPVIAVAEAAWAAVHGEKLHTTVGKTADRLAFASRWMPGRLRKQTRTGGRALGG